MEKITVFTPTYNRAYTLINCYKSLINQTCNDFIWIIVDDGSTDNTQELVEKWIKENKIKIEYYKQKNLGKMQAHNLGVEKTLTELFTCLDSDDYYTEQTIEVLLESYKKCKDNNCIGMFASKFYSDGKCISNKNLPLKLEKATLQEIYNKYKYGGDSMLIYKTNIINKFKFLKINGEKFIPETYLYDQLDLEGKLYIIHSKKMYIAEYLNDGYTRNAKKNIASNPRGYMLYANQGILLNKQLKYKFISSIKFVVGCLIANEKNIIKKSNNKFLVIVAYPFGLIYYLKYYWRLK